MRRRPGREVGRLLVARARAFLRPERRLRGLWALLCFVVLTLTLLPGLDGGRLNLLVGQVAPRDIEAPRDFLDRPTTERLRREAAAAVQPVYTQDRQVAADVDAALAQAFSLLRAIRSAQGIETAAKAEGLSRSLGVRLSPAAAQAALTADDATLSAAERDLRGLVARQMEKQVTAADLPVVRLQVATEIRSLIPSRSLAEFLVALAEAHLRPNYFVDEERTRQLRAAAVEAVTPVQIVKGQVIVRRGDRVTPEDLVRLQDAGLLDQGARAGRVAGAALVAAALVGAAAVTLWRFRPQVYGHLPHLVLFGLVGLGAALLGKGLGALSPLLVPAPGAAMLLTILLDPVTAFVAAALLSILAGVYAGFALEPAALAFLGSLAGVFGVLGATQRGQIIRAGFLVALAQVAVSLSFTLAGGGVEQAKVTADVLASLANGVLLAGVLTAGSLPFFENLFGLLTPFRLLELADPNQPLLRRLLLEAPGTYHHSLLVANLAEAAAEAVGANALLARVGAYYHDIGKIRRPYFFVENQFGGRNPHDRLSPHLSALVITSHVKDGLELARQYRLPEGLTRFIREHHGTTLVGYFYQRAVAAAGGGQKVGEERFRHQGPIPQSRETAIVMLADGAEAIVRSLPQPTTPRRLQAAVRRLIRERLEDGQLDGCPLTLRDLAAIADAFVRVLSGVFHARIEYPDQAPAEQGGRALDGGAERKPGLRPTRSAG